jgi:hypothetical protein
MEEERLFLGGLRSTPGLIRTEGRDIGEHMESTLQNLFVKSAGKPVMVGPWLVTQAARIPICHGVVTVRFISAPDSTEGICLKAKQGTILLSDGSATETLRVWCEPNLPAIVRHRVQCPRELLLWNIYRVYHPTGETTEDYWTGEAGMVLLAEQPRYRRYGCSDWRSPFDPYRLVFDIEWCEETEIPEM